MAQQSENWIHCRHHSKAKVNWAANISAAVRSEKRYRVFHAASLFLTNLFFRFPPFNFLSLIFLLRSEWRKRKLKEIWICAEIRYYNSKYIDAEETDVSRNQTSTWLMKAEVSLHKKRYTKRHWSGDLIFAVWRKNVALVAQWIPPQQTANKPRFKPRLNESNFKLMLLSFFAVDGLIQWIESMNAARKQQLVFSLMNES